MIIDETEFAPLELSKKLLAIGFSKETLFYHFPNEKNEYKLTYGGKYIGKDHYCIQTNVVKGFFNLTIPAPTWQSVFKWFREKHNLTPSFNPYSNKYEFMIFNLDGVSDGRTFSGYESFEEVEEKCVEEMIKLIN